MSSSTVDREVLEAAQTLCMLAMGNRPQEDVNRDNAQEDDDCIITHVRPVVDRQEDAKGDETEDDDACIITGTEDDDIITGTDVPGVNHRYHPYSRPEPQQARLTVDRSGVLPERDEDGESMEISGCTLPSFREMLTQSLTPIQRRATVRDANFPSNTYGWRSLCLQALLTIPPGEWTGVTEMIECLDNKYPHAFFEKYYDPRYNKMSRNMWQALDATLNRYNVVEKLEQPLGLRNKWRVNPGAWEDAVTMAWVKKPRAA